MKAHLPAGAKGPSTAGYSGGPPGTVLTAFEAWNLPPIPGVLTQRTISVEVAALNGKLIGVRTDGEAIWQTPRPAWEVVPSTATTAVLTAHGSNLHTGRPTPTSAPVTLTPAQTRTLARFINSDEIVQPGVSSCPFAIDELVTVVFKDASGNVVARADESPTGCASITLMLGTRTGPELSDYPSMTDELVRVGAIPRCTGAQLSASTTPPGRNGPVDARSLGFSFLNHSTALCTLAGFPKLELFDPAGHRLPVTVTDSGASTVRQEGISATSVLDPRTPAGFGLTYTTCAGASTASSARVTLPGVAKAFTLPIGSHTDPVTPCSGAVAVGNL